MGSITEYSCEDADYTIPTPGILASELIFADAEGDGTNELVVGDQGFPDTGRGTGVGVMVVCDLSNW